jgi:hypothetical protein
VLSFPGFENASLVRQFSHPLFQLSQDFSGDSFSPSFGQRKHSLDFHGVRGEFFYRATANRSPFFVYDDRAFNFVNLIELDVERVVTPVSFYQVSVKSSQEFNKVVVV